MAVGSSEKAYSQGQTFSEKEITLSERAYNLVIGGMLLWGFLLNYLMVEFFGSRVRAWTYSINPLLFLLIYFAMVIVGERLLALNKPVLAFIGYTLITAPIGMIVCMSVHGVPTDIVKSAVLITAVITLSFMIAGTVFLGFFLKLGRVLFLSLLCMIVGSLLSLLLFRSRNYLIYEWLGAGIFSMYIGYDWARANTCETTLNNAIRLSASLYLDIINLLLRIVRILNRSRK